MNNDKSILHYGVAEQGKLHALDGDHMLALQYYRLAMKMTIDQKSPEVFFRHYLECSLESLELMESYDDVIAYCDKAIAHYKQNPPSNEVAQKDLANIYQRRGIVLLKKGLHDEALYALQKAIALIKNKAKVMPLAVQFQRWIAANYHFNASRVVQEQKSHRYFLVRKDTVSKEKAIRIPDNILFASKQSSLQEALHAGQ